jgi:hypothetical protein
MLMCSASDIISLQSELQAWYRSFKQQQRTSVHHLLLEAMAARDEEGK